MELFWRRKIPEKSQQDFSNTATARRSACSDRGCGIFVSQMRVGRWSLWTCRSSCPCSLHLLQITFSLPSYQVLARLLPSPKFCTKMMHRHVVCSKAETTTAVLGGGGGAWGGGGGLEAEYALFRGPFCCQRWSTSWKHQWSVLSKGRLDIVREMSFGHWNHKLYPIQGGGGISGQVQHGMLKGKWCLGSSIRQKVAEEAGGVHGK